MKTVLDNLLEILIIVIVVGLCVLYSVSNHRNYLPSYNWARYHSTNCDNDVAVICKKHGCELILEFVLSEGWEFKSTDNPVTNCYGLTVYKDKIVMLWDMDDYVVLHELGHVYGSIVHKDTSEEYADAFAAEWIECVDIYE